MTDEIILPFDNPVEAALVAEYTAWLKANGLEDRDGDAMDLWHSEEELTDEQRTWLWDFITRWEAADL